MSDKPDAAAPDAAAAPKKKSKKLLVILSAVFVVLLGGGAAAYFVLRAPAEAGEAKDGKKEQKPLDLAAAGIVNFEPFIVNLADANAKRFLRINVRLIVGEAEEAEHIQKSEVLLMRLRSDILDLLTEQTSDHIATAEGKAELKKAIAERAHATVAPAEVADVLFSDFVVQY
jgi:flagellar FliL protein